MKCFSIALLSFVLTPCISIPLSKRAMCQSYTLINTRGTGETPGESGGFVTMNNNIMHQMPGGTIYNTNYPANDLQINVQGVQDIINHVHSSLAANPNECFILQGYSQGAATTVSALAGIAGADFDAVKGVFLIGDPLHTPNLACNVDTNGGSSTRDVRGFGDLYLNGIPDSWISKSLDVCAYGDGVCDTLHGLGVNDAHHIYGGDAGTQNMGTQFALAMLQGRKYTP